MPYRPVFLYGGQYGDQRTNGGKVCLDFKLIPTFNLLFAHLAAFGVEIIAFDWKLSLTIPLRLILLAHCTTKVPFSLVQEPKCTQLPWAIRPGFFLP